MTSRPRPRSLALAVAAAALLAGACSAEVSTGGSSVDAAELEQQVATQIAAEAGIEEPPVSCPDDLEAEEGATTTCALTVTDAAGDEVVYDVDVQVSAVNDGTVDFDLQVADEPRS